MKRSFLMLAALLLPTSALADGQNGQSKIIPLDQIWGYNLPGTRDIAGIPLPETDPQQDVIGRTDAMFRRQREHDIEQFRRALTAKPPTERGLSGFVLARQPDFYTLQRASGRVAGMTRQGFEERGIESEAFRASEDMTLVFFSHAASYYVRLRKVERQGNEIIVHYEFEPHTSPEVTVHFALIPLGKLPADEYHVDFEQIPLAQKYREIGFEPVEPDANSIVCRPFKFRIVDLPPPNKPPAGAISIPLNRIWAFDMPNTRDVRELEPQLPDAGNMSDEELIRRHKIQQILYQLSKRPKQGDKAGAMFVVVGSGKEALKSAADILYNKKQPVKSLPADTDLTLVFYSYICGRYVRIASVEQSPELITVKYQIVAHPETHMTRHFALIPLGKLREGNVQVQVQQVESSDQFSQKIQPLGEPLRFVSSSSSFEVRK